MAARQSGGTELPDFIVDEWGGLNTAIKSAKDLPIGVSPDALNWITGWDPNQKKGDHIELRRGMSLLGTDRRLGAGGVQGLGIGASPNGVQVPYWSYGGSLLYYNAATNINTGFYTLPTAAVNDFVSMEPFQSIAGNFIYISSKNSSLYKSAVANLGSILDIKNGTFQGNINFSNRRMNLWNKNGNAPGTIDQIDYFQSATDFGNYSDMSSYPAANTGPDEVYGTGDGSTKTFAHTISGQNGGSVSQLLVAGATSTLANITAVSTAAQAVITTDVPHGLNRGDFFIVDGMTGGFGGAFNQRIVQALSVGSTTITSSLDTVGNTYGGGGVVYGAEWFTDDQEGKFNSNKGGTGTVNYITGACSVTFINAPINSGDILITYFYQIPGTGVENFTIPGSPGATDPYLWPERDGGGLLSTVQPFNGQNYSLHQLKTWVNTPDNGTYTNSTNIPYRNKIGTPFFKSAFSTGDGIIFVDTSNPSYPRFQVLSISPNTNEATIVPERLSDNLDLTLYGFDYPPVIYWNQYYIFGCQNIINGNKQNFNGATFVMNTDSGYWDKLDYQLSLMDEYYGGLLGGSSVSNNLFMLFSGFDDDGAYINNYWTSGLYNLGWEGLKSTEQFIVEGLMQVSQALQIWVSYDQGPFTLVQTINGTDNCVSKGNPQLVGSSTLGFQSVGSGAVYANPYLLDFSLASDWYNYIQVKFVSTGIGYIEVDKWALSVNHKKSMGVQAINTL